MKTNAFLYIALAAALALTACGGGDDPDEPTPQPPTPTQPKGKHLTQQCDMPADASEITIRLQGLSSEVSRKSGSASWLTTTLVPYTSGTPEVTVACTQNLTTATRSQEVTFIGQGNRAEIWDSKVYDELEEGSLTPENLTSAMEELGI